MCLLCSSASDDRDQTRRAHVLQLLALVEHPDALPSDAALRLAREILALTGQEASCRCEAVALPDADLGTGSDRRSS